MLFQGWPSKKAPTQRSFVSCSCKTGRTGTSLVVQRLRIHLAMQGTWVQSLVWDDPSCHRGTNPVHHNYWSLCALEAALLSMRSPYTTAREQPQLSKTRESLHAATKTQYSQNKKNVSLYLKKKKKKPEEQKVSRPCPASPSQSQDQHTQSSS